jgi:hypothetical protein
MEKVFILAAAILAVYLVMRLIEWKFLDTEEERMTMKIFIRDALMVTASVFIGGTAFFYFDRYLVGFFDAVLNTEAAAKVVDRENIQMFTDDPGF